MMRRSWVLACVICAPASAFAQTVVINDGVYDAFDCAVPISDQRIEIKGNQLSFYESTCEIDASQPLEGFENTLIFEATCQGEGEVWSARFVLMQTRDGGLSMMSEMWGDHYERCE